MSATGAGRAVSPWRHLLENVPRGERLSSEAFESRHRGVLVLAYAQAFGLALFGLFQGVPIWQALLEGTIVASVAAVASWDRLAPRFRSSAACLSLVTASAVLVQFSGGVIEAHFHFFIMLAVVALYQDYVPLLVAILYVAVDHGVTGQFWPQFVYNHADAIAHPWKWAIIHAVMVLGESAALLVGWRIMEAARSETELVLNSTADGIFGLDQKGNIRSANPAAVALTGRPRELLLGAPFWQLLAECPKGRPRLADEQVRSTDDRLKLPDGRLLPIEWTANPAVRGGDIAGYVLAVQDISERKKVEELMLYERNAAEAAARLKSEFLANMSHEIRTPLNAVVGMTSLMQDTPLNDEQREYLRTIEASGEALLGLISDILDISKMEAGMLELESTAFEVNQVLEEAVSLLATRAAEKGVEIAYLLDPSTPPVVLGDSARLRQVLVNLLANGVKFTDEGEVVVRVTARPAEGRHHELHLTVEDTGIGIPPDRVERLFKPFSQVDASTTRTHGGTGLGLAISRRIVQAMGGRIWVESEVGRGSTFHVVVQLEAVPMAPKLLRVPAGQLAGLRVLVVDDLAINRQILVGQLSSWGMVPVPTGNPAEALAWVERGDPFDLAILDYMMPGMNGITLAQQIRRLRPETDLPLLVLSSAGKRPVEVQASGVRFAAFLTKPIRRSALCDVVSEALAGVVQARGGASRSAEPNLARMRPLKILLAEDVPANQKVALGFLSRLGYQADVVANGQEVLGRLAREHYDVLLLDVQMPVLDGPGTTAAIHERFAEHERPWIIAMTAHALQGDREKYMGIGMDDYISKPIAPSALREALLRAPPGGGPGSGRAPGKAEA